MDADIAVVLRAYAAFARGDIDVAVADLDRDVDWIEPPEFPGGGRLTGPGAVADYLRASRSTWSELTSEPTAYRRGDDIVVIHHVHGRLLDGTPHDATVADVFTVRAGKVVRMVAYADPAAVARCASLEGCRFIATATDAAGEVSSETVFTYHEDSFGIWADYAGGAIRRGHLVGTRVGDRLDFRYAQLNSAGDTSTGHCRSTVVTLPDGRLRLDEQWEWESRPGSGTSTVTELR